MAPGIVANGDGPVSPWRWPTAHGQQRELANEAAEKSTVASESPDRSSPEPPGDCQVCVVGAGPAGLMLSATLARYGVDVLVVDDRPDQTSAGRADGLQPKTIETFRQLRLADTLLQRGVRVYDISFWRSTDDEPLHRLGREIHYPPVIDVLDPYILLVHQGVVESLFIDDLKKRGKDVQRNSSFESYHRSEVGDKLQVQCRTNVTQDDKTYTAQYLVGCDGAHSKVRKSVPGVEAVGMSQPSIWGVLDGELITDFPDIWSKTLVYSEEHGSILIVPRERNMTRFYIELKTVEASADKRQLAQAFVMEQARKIMAPYSLSWKYMEWFGRYQVGQRVANRFTDEHGQVFLAGDASHTHSPKSAQGMNTSIHDAWNLSWKLNLAVRGLAKPDLLASYEEERRKIALDLVNFDYEHANQIAAGDAIALAKNFRANVRFISGVGAEYAHSPVNRARGADAASFGMPTGEARPGCLLPPAKVTRYIDSNPVDVQIDIPMLGQFRIFLLMWDVQQAAPFLANLSHALGDTEKSLVCKLSAAASRSYAEQPRLGSPEDDFIRPERYTAVSHLFTFAVITTMPKSEMELSDLPKMLQESRWTVYLDNIPEQDTKGRLCTEKWLGGLQPGEVAILNVRPDGYVGSLGRWDAGADDAGVKAAQWLDDYYGGFLKVPEEHE